MNGGDIPLEDDRRRTLRPLFESEVYLRCWGTESAVNSLMAEVSEEKRLISWCLALLAFVLGFSLPLVPSFLAFDELFLSALAG